MKPSNEERDLLWLAAFVWIVMGLITVVMMGLEKLGWIR